MGAVKYVVYLVSCGCNSRFGTFDDPGDAMLFAEALIYKHHGEKRTKVVIEQRQLETDECKAEH